MLCVYQTQSVGAEGISMMVTTVVDKQVATMITDNCQLCLKIPWEHSSVSALLLPRLLISDILMLCNYCYLSF